MTTVDIEKLSAQELAALIARANRRKKLLAKRKPAAQTRAAVEKVLKAHGWTFEELYGKAGHAAAAASSGKKPRKAAATKRGGNKVPPKYRNPANENETWTGRGRPPRWLAALLASGRTLEEFLIQK
jgi:DNA-binding protein H-NS